MGIDEAIRIEIDGVPVGKGRPRFVRFAGKVGTYTPAKTRSYGLALALAAKLAMHGRQPFLGAVSLRVWAYFPIPPSWSRKKREEALLGLWKHCSKPDIDNLAKAATDPLNGIAFRDDSQVVDCRIVKRYSEVPRLVVEVEPILLPLPSPEAGL